MKNTLGITSHAWNSDFTKVAVATGSELLEVYELQNGKWNKAHVLAEHTQIVSSVDWNPVTNRIITGSHDRNVVIWEFDRIKNTWKPQLVNINQNRGVLDVNWATHGQKFAVGTGSRLVGVGHPSEVLQGWNTRKVRPHESSVTCVRFDSSGLVIASGSTDRTIKLVTAYIEEVDDNITHSGPFAAVRSFGEVIYEIDAGAWVNALAWSPDCTTLCAATHNSALIFTDFREQQNVKWSGRPFATVAFLNPSVVLAAGWDFCPVKFTVRGNGWSEGEKVSQAGAGELNRSSSKVLAMRKMLEGTKEREASKSFHQNAITCIRVIDEDRYSTSDVEGTLHIWS